MSPVAVAADLFPAALVGADSSLVTVQSIGGVDLRRPIGIAVGWTVLTLVVGGVLLAGFSSPLRAIRDDAVERPDLAFATGFLVFFAPLVVASLPLFVTAYVVEHPAVLGLGALVSLPALLVCGALVIGGGTIGALVVGDRIASRFGTGTPSLGRSLAIGSVVLGATQLVPVVGTLVAIGFVIVGSGAAVRRRFDPWNGGAERTPIRGGHPRTDRPETTSASRWETSDSNEAAVWHSSDSANRGAETGSESPTAVAGRANGDTNAGDSRRPERGWTAGDRFSADDERARSDDQWTVEDWEWEIGTDREGENEDDGRASEADR
ncbi:ABC transporter permease [Natronorubrum sp. FCH18a]|uniref:ABC transporter permease n=1 Tax=Natronorubrum sp. FCH18a TaxID=3447018 RepID=UPI003F514529